VTAAVGQEGFGETAPRALDLVLRLETTLPSSLPVRRGTALFLRGACCHDREALRELIILVDDTRHRADAWGMPRPDLLRDPEIRCDRSGFWATVPVMAQNRPGTIELRAAARLESGAELVAPLGRIEVVEAAGARVYGGAARRVDQGLIAICMATFEPDMRLFRAQIESLRSQTDTGWICVISDDFSQPQRFDAIRKTVDGDARFLVSRSDQRLGFYRNFERALRLVPAEAEFVALCDQDDRWYPEKLEVLRGALGGARLVYSDQRLVDAEGRVRRETLWERRRNNHTNLASLLIANSVTGAATLFRREVAQLVLPFPETPGWQFHDHWLGLVALASGEVAYVDRPLYDYVQHAGAIFGDVSAQGAPIPGSRTRRRGMPYLRGPRELLGGWRAAYFYGFLSRAVLAQAILERCSARITAGKRRALRRFVASERSPVAFVWLATRPLRALVGRNETLGTEALLARGIVWRWLIAICAARRRVPRGGRLDASFPNPDTYEEKRLRRWRAQL
jgi:glycosyltransferase involved in cell wall biosynthesis